jgi:cytochrome c biogenesis protein CcmG, thiol:disulfide interchange protein DsbE
MFGRPDASRALNRSQGMNELRCGYATRGLKIYAINVDKRKEAAERFLRKSPSTLTVVNDPASQPPKQFAIAGMPSSCLIDSSGRVLFMNTGFRESDRATIERAIVEALARTKN